MTRRATLKNDEPVVLRPVCPDDESALRVFHRHLSDRSVYQRYFHMLGLAFRTDHARLAAVCAPDPSRETVLVLVHEQAVEPAVIGVGRLTCLTGTADAEFAVIVADAWQGIGAGAVLLRGMIDEARRRRVGRLGADVLSDNVDMARLCRACGLRVGPGSEPGLMRAELLLER